MGRKVRLTPKGLSVLSRIEAISVSSVAALNADAGRRHAQLATRSKIFSGASTAFGAAPGVRVEIKNPRVVVEHGALAPMDDFPGSMAPSVMHTAIRDALASSFVAWESISERAEQNAVAIAAEWSWENKNVPAIRRMLQEAEKHVR